MKVGKLIAAICLKEKRAGYKVVRIEERAEVSTEPEKFGRLDCAGSVGDKEIAVAYDARFVRGNAQNIL